MASPQILRISPPVQTQTVWASLYLRRCLIIYIYRRRHIRKSDIRAPYGAGYGPVHVGQGCTTITAHTHKIGTPAPERYTKDIYSKISHVLGA
jgi:hypothetical protein